jgi:UDP-2-acetamido-3-amino-2,3-dideoxy-glucuronate N-acetyltransferase
VRAGITRHSVTIDALFFGGQRRGREPAGLEQEMGIDMSARIHPTADVSPEAEIGEGTAIWHQAQIREGVRIGPGCIISKGVYIDSGVTLGQNVKVQNNVSIYHGVTIESSVFCGPHCVFTNDKWPRAVNPDGTIKSADDWQVVKTLVREGASIGANATIICGVTIGRWAMVGAGSVVTRDVPDYGLVLGNPAQLYGFVCPCGVRLPSMAEVLPDEATMVQLVCATCGRHVEVPAQVYRSIGGSR